MAKLSYRAYSSGPRKKTSRKFLAIIPILILLGVGAFFLLSKEAPTEDTGTDQNPTGNAVSGAGGTTANQNLPVVPPTPASATNSSIPTTSVGPELSPEQLVASMENPIGLSARTTSPEGVALIARAKEHLSQNQVIKARDTLDLAMRIQDSLSPADLQFVKTTMSKLADTWLFGPTVLSGDLLCSSYAVKSGDNLTSIAARNKTSFEILMKINRLTRPESLRAGQNIKVINGPFNAVISRSTFTLDLYLQNTYIRSFKISIGDASKGHETPTGLWQVQSGGKMLKPKWTDPDTGRTYLGSDPDYPLGTHWIGLEGMEGDALGRQGFALHGTNRPESLGQAVSRGCIRLANENVELLYGAMIAVHSQVRVND